MCHKASSCVQLYIDLSYYSPLTGYQPPPSSLRNSSETTSTETGGAHHQTSITVKCILAHGVLSLQRGKNSQITSKNTQERRKLLVVVVFCFNVGHAPNCG